MKTHNCEQCGAPGLTGKSRYCEACKKERKRKRMEKYLQKPEVRERLLAYRTRPDVKERLKEYRQRPEIMEKYRKIYHQRKVSAKRYCKRCGAELTRKHVYFCDACRMIRRREITKKYLEKPETKKMRRDYYRRPEVKEKIRVKRLEAKARGEGQETKKRYCKQCGKEIEKKKQYCDECRKARIRECHKKYFRENKEYFREYFREYSRKMKIKQLEIDIVSSSVLQGGLR
jgi:predicted amidophosphoribosyltransferase